MHAGAGRADTRSMRSSATETSPRLGPAGSWAIDPEASTVGFRVRHFHFATVEGRFGEFSGELGPWGAAGTVDVASIDTGNAIRDGRLRSPDLFDAARFPEIAFETRGQLAPRLAGRLTIRDVTNPVTLEVTQTPEPDALRISARASISRRAFGLDWDALREAGRLVVGDRVELLLDLVARPA